MSSTLGPNHQVQSRSLLQSLFYSMSKRFFDEIDIEINGDRKGKLFGMFFRLS